nr:RIP metalloprotease RseP [Candidatus Syntrophosphaera sp.]
MTLLYTILAFGAMIFIHELGHYKVARWFRVGIEKFSIGFGKPIKEWKRDGVIWRIGWIPLGGYVKMRGENPDAPDKDAADSFFRLAWWKKALIGFSGPFANLLLGLMLFILSFILPVHIQDQYPVISRAEGAWTQVFAPGDSILSVNGRPVQGFSEFLESLLETQQSTVTFRRTSETKTARISATDVDSLLNSVYPIADTRVGEVVPKTAAYHAKLQPGDRITAVDSVAVADWYTMREVIVN